MIRRAPNLEDRLRAGVGAPPKSETKALPQFLSVVAESQNCRIPYHLKPTRNIFFDDVELDYRVRDGSVNMRVSGATRIKEHSGRKHSVAPTRYFLYCL
jgi:hypothetical protein